jgi:hypothetical protein
MNDDVLARAARALREETAGDDAGARFTRSRVMASVHEDRVKRRTRWAFLIPIAAMFVVGSAFGAATGAGHGALEVVARALGIHRSSTPAPKVISPRTPSVSHSHAPLPNPGPAPNATPAPTDEPAPASTSAQETAVPPPTAALAAAAPAPLARSGASTASVSAAPTASAPDPTFELYRSAHQAHFVDRDWSRALAGWDAYLRAAPRGALAPEARYNRALCLLRLHRNQQARAALEPFAQGSYGTYRREEAQKLIEALPADAAGP